MKKGKNKNFTKLTQKKGISLIVLIVTIIVTIILAAVVILTINQNTPVGSAREAVFKENIRTFQDELALSISKKYMDNQGQRGNNFDATTFDEIKDYIPSFTEKYKDKFVIENGGLKYIGDAEKEANWSKNLGIKTNPIVPSEWKNSISEVTEDGVPIPKGFTYLTGTKETGTVIQDEIGNEFVWIPATEAEYVKDLNLTGVTPTGDDTLPNGITDETADVKKYGGFYIARYEAGVPNGDTSPSNKTGVPVSKQGSVVWTEINYTNAKASAESMISNEYVQTGLLTGKAWDRTCHWIEDYITTLNASSSLDDSRYYGNYKNSLAPANVTGHGTNQVAGFSEKWSTKNIYDLAGNVWEWTAEAYNSNRISRGGHYGDNGDNYSILYRDNLPSRAGDPLSFRPRLYIK